MAFVKRIFAIAPCALTIFLLLIIIHTGLLVFDVFIVYRPDHIVGRFVNLIDTKDGRLYKEEDYQSFLASLTDNSREYLALPITLDAVLLIFNVLAIWGTAANISLLLMPWILSHLLVMAGGLALLIYAMILLPEDWFRAILFLVVAPFLMIILAFWLIVVRLYVLMLKSSKKVKGTAEGPRPSTVYTPQPHSWDTPLPIWAVSPPSTTWDPDYLQQIDPRFLPTPTQSSRATSYRSRKSSYRSRSRAEDSDSDGSYDKQCDSLSLSDKYGQPVGEDRLAEQVYVESDIQDLAFQYDRAAEQSDLQSTDYQDDSEYHHNQAQYSSTEQNSPRGSFR